MFSVEPGVYTAEKQPDIVVTYGGELRDDPHHSGPWIQWRFAWEPESAFVSTVVFQFTEMLKAAGYKLTMPAASLGFRMKVAP